jgi:hypothetical protein
VDPVGLHPLLNELKEKAISQKFAGSNTDEVIGLFI